MRNFGRSIGSKGWIAGGWFDGWFPFLIRGVCFGGPCGDGSVPSGRWNLSAMNNS